MRSRALGLTTSSNVDTLRRAVAFRKNGCEVSVFDVVATAETDRFELVEAAVERERGDGIANALLLGFVDVMRRRKLKL